MSKPSAYTVQLTKKANGTLQMRLMIPGFEAIVMKPEELRDVAAGIESMFSQVRHAVVKPSIQSLEERVRALESVLHTNLTASTSRRIEDK